MASEEASKIGRPSIYSQELADTICDRLADGESLRSICRDPAMPSKMTVWRWLDSKPDFCAQYARARELQAENFFEEIVEIADDGSRDTYMKQNEDGSEYPAVDYDHIQRSKLRVDARKWVAARMAPKKYADPGRQLAANPEDDKPKLIDGDGDIP